jgi:hypothetical protein
LRQRKDETQKHYHIVNSKILYGLTGSGEVIAALERGKGQYKLRRYTDLP